MYMFEMANGLKICNNIHKKFGPWGFLLIDEKMNLVSNCHVKKICEICRIFVQQIIL